MQLYLQKQNPILSFWGIKTYELSIYQHISVDLKNGFLLSSRDIASEAHLEKGQRLQYFLTCYSEFTEALKAEDIRKTQS